MCQYPPANPTISASLNHSWPVIHLVVFLISSQRYFFADMQSTTERVEEKNKRTNTDLGQLQAQEAGKSIWHFLYILCFCELTRTCTQVKTFTKPLAMLTWLLALVHPASRGHQVLAAAFLTSVNWSPLCLTVISLTDLFSWLVPSAPFC